MKKLFERNTYGVCRELPDQASRGNIAVKKGSHEETDDNHFEASVLLVVVFTVALYFYDNDIAMI